MCELIKSLCKTLRSAGAFNVDHFAFKGADLIEAQQATIATLTEQARALEESTKYILTLCENENVPDMLTKYPEDGHLVALINIKRVAKQMKKYLAKEAE